MENKKDNKKNTGLGLVQTKGFFQAVGIVSGTDSEKFYKEGITSTKKSMRSINFALEVNKGKKIYCSLMGFAKDSVYFFKTEKENGVSKTISKPVKWEDRFSFNEDGYSLAGVHLGVKKALNEKGALENEKISCTDYDACKIIADNLKDGMSVFVKGKIEYSSYNDKNYTKFVPTQISLCSKDIDFESESFKEMAVFEQTICYMGIEQNTETKKFEVSAKNIGYSDINDIELYIENQVLAKTFKKNLKPYTSIRVSGNISVSENVEDIKSEESSVWGEENPLRKVFAPTTRELVIIGAEPDTIDTDIYSEEKIDNAIASIKASKAAKNDFETLTGKKIDDDWGSSSSINSTDDDDDDFWS